MSITRTEVPLGAAGASEGDATREPLWSVPQLAEFLGVRPKTVYTWVEQGLVPYYKIRGRVRFDPTEVHRWLKSRRGGV